MNYNIKMIKIFQLKYFQHNKMTKIIHYNMSKILQQILKSLF
jgi:hypothetical protein